MVLAHNINEKNRTKDVKILQNVTFDTMLLSPKTLKGLQNSGFYQPSPVQLHGIPLGKCGFDLLLEAKSGTGKTAVFTVVALEKIDLSMGLQAVILTPTREIASQICDVLKQIGSAYTGLCVEVVMGGLPVQDDIDKFNKNKVHIVVASPGRLKHLIQDQHMDVSAVRLLVLDEADKLMEKSFLPDIKYINSVLPRQKQVIMSSATYPESSREFLNQFVRGAQHICPENNSVLLGVSQKVTYVKYNSNILKQTKIRFEELIKILSNLPFKQCLIFCNYQVRVAELQRMLKKADWPVEMLHGQQDQSDRLGALKTLQEYKCRILISTDLASRGIDASNIDLVINFEPPFEWQTYLHRIGRAGRFGSYGTAITITSEGTEQKKFINLFKSLNSSLILNCLWNNNEIDKGTINIENTQINKLQSNKKDLNDIEHSKDSTEIANSLAKLQSHEKDLSDIEHSKDSTEIANSLQATKVNHESNIKECYNLLFTTCESKVEITAFTDLMLSYENYDITDTETKYDYNCSDLPDKSIKVSPGSLYISPNKEQLLCTPEHILKDEHIEKIDSDVNSNVDRLGFPKESINSLVGAKLNEYDSNMDFVKLGLPTAFSSYKNNIFNKGYQIKRREPKKTDKIKAGKTSSSNDISHDTISKNKNYTTNISTDHQKPETSNFKENAETTRRHKVIEGNLRHKSQSGSDINIYNNSYLMWYKQLKLRTKQIELALYVDELSRV